ncbi:MAG: SDR family NAD(P)-dependent oxidoreductase [Bacilli bacterium]|nr:SDR family NAD(P)-dependent oxidoreductase [Bacilli bacterium]
MSSNYVVLTGANGGLGRNTTLALLNNNYQVIGIDIAPSNITHSNYTHYVCDLTNDAQRQELITNIKNQTNHIYAIINLAGIFMMQSIIEGSSKDLNKIIQVNFFSMYYLNKELIELLDNNSRIINMSSEIAIYSPQPFMGYYAITKKMVDTYSDVLRRECNYLGIKVVKIQSGSMKTKMLTKADSEYQEMLNNTKYFKSPLTTMKYMMDREITKNANPNLIANLMLKILKVKKPKIRYRIKNSKALRFMNALPEKMQDNIYKKVIK